MSDSTSTIDPTTDSTSTEAPATQEHNDRPEPPKANRHAGLIIALAFIGGLVLLIALNMR
jgi:hypothetical protein